MTSARTYPDDDHQPSQPQQSQQSQPQQPQAVTRPRGLDIAEVGTMELVLPSEQQQIIAPGRAYMVSVHEKRARELRRQARELSADIESLEHHAAGLWDEYASFRHVPGHGWMLPERYQRRYRWLASQLPRLDREIAHQRARWQQKLAEANEHERAAAYLRQPLAHSWGTDMGTPPDPDAA